MEARQSDDGVTMIFFFVNFNFIYWLSVKNIQNHRYMIEPHNSQPKGFLIRSVRAEPQPPHQIYYNIFSLALHHI
jgi:hypothetical protein